MCCIGERESRCGVVYRTDKRSPSRADSAMGQVASAGEGGGVRFSGVRALPLQHSSTAGNLIGPELSPMRRSRPAVARWLSIRAPVPCPPCRPRTGSRHAAIVYPRRLNAFVSPDAKTTHSFRAPSCPAPAGRAPHRGPSGTQEDTPTDPHITLFLQSSNRQWTRSHHWLLPKHAPINNVIITENTIKLCITLSITNASA